VVLFVSSSRVDHAACGGGGLLLLVECVPVESGQQAVQVGGGELPSEQLCCGVVAALEVGQPLLDLVEVGEVVRG